MWTPGQQALVAALRDWRDDADELLLKLSDVLVKFCFVD